MITFLFWNKKPLQSLIAKLAEEHDVDVLIFAECLIPPDVLLQSINRSGRTYSYSPSDSCERIEIYTRFSPEFSEPVLDGREFRNGISLFLTNLKMVLSARMGSILS